MNTDATHDPNFLLSVSIIKELMRTGIFSQNECQNVVMDFARMAKTQINDDDYKSRVTILAALADPDAVNKMYKEMGMPEPCRKE